MFCDDVCGDGGFTLVMEQDGTAKLELVASKNMYGTDIIMLDGGSGPVIASAYRPITSGTVKVTFKKAQNWEGGLVAETIVKCYNVDEDGNITEIDESEVTLLNMGDCNLDNKFTVSDVVMLQKWLVGSGELKCWQNADFNNDNRVDVFDLLLMKKALTEKLPLVPQKSEKVTDDDITMLKQTALMKYPDTDMSDFTFVYEPDHQLNHQFNGKLFSVYYKDVLLHGYGNINTDQNVYAVIKEKDNYKSVEMNFVVDPERFKKVNLDGEYKSAEEI
ncbi:MAG: dockerin type I repeat-containing protein, partial [Ruminococcus sp.]|nr:dockerin type I repeat-containing protein [Ruminococcus sp.]